MMTNFQQAKRQIQHQIQQQQHCYTTLPTGWGCSCPEAKSIQSKQECASAADSLLPERNRYKLPQEQQQGNVSQETNANGDAVNDQDNTPSIQVYENQWQYGPCGCFFWKNDQKVYYTGDRTNEMHCIAVEWAELICRTSQGESSKNDTDIDVMEVTEIVEEKYLDLNNIFAIGRNPEEHPRKCLDWYIFKPLHVSVDRRYCLGFDIPPLLPATNDQNHDGTSMKKVISHNTTFPAYLKKCADIELYYDTWLYNNLQIMTRHQTYGFVYCLQVNGTNDTNGSEESDALSSQVTVGICNGSYPPYVENPAQQWVFDSRGRFRNVLNGQFLSVHGSTVGNNCYHALKEGDLIVTTDSSMNNGCDFTSWSPFWQFNDRIDTSDRLWKGVYSIYGPTVFVIICIFVTGCVQLKKQHDLLNPGRGAAMRRPGVHSRTRAFSLLSSSLSINTSNNTNSNHNNRQQNGVYLSSRELSNQTVNSSVIS